AQEPPTPPASATAQAPAAPADGSSTPPAAQGDQAPGGAPAGNPDPWAALGLPPAGASGAATEGNSAGDPWGFDEAVQEESWRDILRPQAMDLAVTTAFFAFALVSFFRKSVALKYTALAMSVVYLGV